MQPVTIKLFLVNGSPIGLRTAELSNWSGKAIAGPRSGLEELLERPELANPGVYMLSGEDAESGSSLIYIGESENVCKRLRQHIRTEEKDYWTHTHIFVSKDENLTKSHIRYIEGRMIEKAENSKQVKVMNSAASGASLPEADRADMDVFIERMIQLLPVLGIHYFTTPATSTDKQSSFNKNKRQLQQLYYSGKGIKATGMRSEGGFTVFTGSEAVRNITNSCPKPAQNYRTKLIEQGILVDIGNCYGFTQDYEFLSPSAASDVVAGGSTSGMLHWKDKQGRSLKDVEREE